MKKLTVTYTELIVYNKQNFTYYNQAVIGTYVVVGVK